ncbi:protein kinase family protein [Spongorhabdus nitratireducens]
MKSTLIFRCSTLLILLLTVIQVHAAQVTGILLSFKVAEVPDFINSNSSLPVACSDLGRTIQSLPWELLQIGLVEEGDTGQEQGFKLTSFNDAISSGSEFKLLTLSQPIQAAEPDCRAVILEDVEGESSDEQTIVTMDTGPWQRYVLAIIPPDGVWYQLLFIYNEAFKYGARLDEPCQLVSHYPPAKMTAAGSPVLNFTRFPEVSDEYTDNPELAWFGWYWPIRVLQSRMIDCLDPEYLKHHPVCPTLFWSIKPSKEGEEVEPTTVTPESTEDPRIYPLWSLDNHCPNGQFDVSADSAYECTIGRHGGSFDRKLLVSVPKPSDESPLLHQVEPFPTAGNVEVAALNYTFSDLKQCCKSSLEAAIASDRSQLSEINRGKVLLFQAFECDECSEIFALSSPNSVVPPDLMQQYRSGYALLIKSGLAQKAARLYFSRASGDQWFMAFGAMEFSIEQLADQCGADFGRVKQAAIVATTALTDFHNKGMVYLNLNTTNILQHTETGDMALSGCGQLRPVPESPVNTLPESIAWDDIPLPPECLVHAVIDGRAQDSWLLGVFIYKMITSGILDSVLEKSQGFDPEGLFPKSDTDHESSAQVIKLLSQLLRSHPAERTAPAALLEGVLQQWDQSH